MVTLKVSEPEVLEVLLMLPPHSKIAKTLSDRLHAARTRAQKNAQAPEGATHYRVISGKKYYYKMGTRTTLMAWNFYRREWMDTALTSTEGFNNV